MLAMKRRQHRGQPRDVGWRRGDPHHAALHTGVRAPTA